MSKAISLTRAVEAKKIVKNLRTREGRCRTDGRMGSPFTQSARITAQVKMISRFREATAAWLLITFHSSLELHGRGRGVGRGLGGGLNLGVGVGRGVAVGVGVAVVVGVGVGVGVAPPAGAWIATIIGEPVLKKPTVALACCGG